MFVDSEDEAEQERSEMIDTLWHMANHDLDVTVSRVERAAADAEQTRLATAAGANPPQVWVSDDLRPRSN